MTHANDEEAELSSAAMQNVDAILAARRRAEEQLVAARETLRASAEHLKFALAAGHLGDWRWEASTDLVTMAPMAAEILGLADTCVTWAEIRESLHEDDRERARVAVEHSLAEHIDYDIEYRTFRASGETRWVSARGRGAYADDGRVLGMTGVVQDITERKHLEEALEDETRVLELLNQAGSAIASQLDLQALVQIVTDAGTQLSNAQFGAFFYSVTDRKRESFYLYALSGAPREAFDKFGVPRNTPLFNPTFRGEHAVRADDITKDPRYGKLAPHYGMPPGHLPVRSYLAVPVVSRSGEPIGGLFFGHAEPGVFSTRSERIIKGIAAQAAVAIDNARLYEQAQRAAEERSALLEREHNARTEAERSSAMKDEFLATLSHELRTPLSSILGWSQLLRRRTPSAEELNKGLEIIDRNARAQTQLIEDLLDMSRITSGNVRLDIRPIDPFAFVEAAIETVGPAAGAKGIRLEKLLDLSAGPISGDPNRLQQVIWNLLSNAIKFTPRGGCVQIRLERVGSNVEISISDTGIGVRSEFLPHVFERFRQADASTTRKHGGLGLGLAIVKHLTELHGGTVRADSAGEGHGTTFVVDLPLLTAMTHEDVAEDRAQPKAPQARAMDYSADLSRARILVVDDERDARELMTRVLADCGAEVASASSAAEALEQIERATPELLVSDIGMPDVDGYELLRRAHALGAEKGLRLPAIALTAFARPEDRTRALRAGFLLHVAKPVEPAELVATVASVLNRTGAGVQT